MRQRAARLLQHRLVAVICARLGASAAGFLVGIALARALGPAGLGDYAGLVAAAGIAATLLCLGTEIPYNLAATSDRRAGGNILVVAAGHAACAFPLAGLAWLILAGAGNAPGTSPVAFALLTAAFVLNQLAQGIMSGLQKQVQVSLILTALLAAQAAAIVALAAFGLADEPAVVMIYTAVLAFPGLAALALHVRGRRTDFSYRAAIGAIFGEGRQYFLGTLAGVLRLRAGIVLMGWYMPARDIGSYQIMQTVTEVLYLVPVTVSTYILSLPGEGGPLARDAARAGLASCAITALCALAAVAALPYAVPWLYGPGFEPVLVHGPLMLTGAVAFAVAKGVSAYFSRMGWARLVTRVEVSTAAVALVAFAFLVPDGALAGAVWSFVIAAWFGALAHVAQLARMLRRATACCPAPQERRAR